MIDEELKAFIVKEPLPRDITAYQCPNCQGYSEIVESTEEEYKQMGCGRPGCCNVTFKCVRCELRIVAHLEAPEME